MASVIWSSRALEVLETLDRPIAERIYEKALWFEKNFDSIKPEPLYRELKSSYKLRVGDYRILYSVRGESVVIEKVGHRRDIYRD